MSGPPVVAIDLGGTKIRSIVVDADGQIHGEDRRETLAERGEAVVIDRMVASVHEAIAASGIPFSSLVAIGVTAPGPVDFERGILYQPPNLPGWDAVPLGRMLQERIGLPAFLENDANAAAFGEWRYGAGQGARHMLYLTISTGVGGGLILDGRLYRGADGSAGELGHIAVDDAGPLHTCGQHGCLEVMASGTAIGRMAREAVEAGRSKALADLAATVHELSAIEVDKAADAGDPVALEILGTASHYLGVGFANYLNIFNPEVIVIGGGVTHIGRLLLDPAIELGRSRAFRLPAQTVEFRRAALEGRAEVLGVGELAREGAGRSGETVGR